MFYLKPICDDNFAVQFFSATQWHLFYSVCSTGQKVKCGRLFHLREGRHIRTRWILHQSHKWVPALNMKAGSVSKMTPPALFSFEPSFTGSHTVFWKPASFLSHKGLWVFFFLTANDEVIVYVPTGGFLGDGSLSAKLWRKPQFLPTEWKAVAKVWIHVGHSVVCLRLCVFHRCFAFFAHSQ